MANFYQKATNGLQNVGRQIASNESQGMKNFRSGKSSYYSSINPLKGTGKAFVGAFKKGGKVKKTGMALVHKGERVIPANKRKMVEKMLKNKGVQRNYSK